MRFFTCAAATAATALTITAVATATPSFGIAGSIAPTSQALTVRSAGSNLLFEGSGTHVWSGSFAGTSTLTGHFAVHNGATITYQVDVTFTGVTPCGAGTVHVVATGSGPFPGPAIGHATTIDQADSIPLHATFDTVLFLTPLGGTLTYTGEAHCG